LKSLKFVDASPKAAIYNNPEGMCGFVVDRPVQYFSINFVDYNFYSEKINIIGYTL